MPHHKRRPISWQPPVPSGCISHLHPQTKPNQKKQQAAKQKHPIGNTAFFQIPKRTAASKQQQQKDQSIPSFFAYMKQTISAQYVLFSKLLPQTIAANPAPVYATFFHSFPVCTSNIPEKLSNISLNLTFRILIMNQREIRIPVTDGRTHP